MKSLVFEDTKFLPKPYTGSWTVQFCDQPFSFYSDNWGNSFNVPLGYNVLWPKGDMSEANAPAIWNSDTQPFVMEREFFWLFIIWSHQLLQGTFPFTKFNTQCWLNLPRKIGFCEIQALLEAVLKTEPTSGLYPPTWRDLFLKKPQMPILPPKYQRKAQK